MAREYGTDPYGIISRGVPGGGGSGISVGRVGNAIRDLSGRSFGSGVGVRFGTSLGGSGGGGSSSASDKFITKAAVKKKAKGGSVKKMAKGGSTASKRADGCATKGKTKGRFV
jgi:hypothetical protein